MLHLASAVENVQNNTYVYSICKAGIMRRRGLQPESLSLANITILLYCYVRGYHASVMSVARKCVAWGDAFCHCETKAVASHEAICDVARVTPWRDRGNRLLGLEPCDFAGGRIALRRWTAKAGGWKGEAATLVGNWECQSVRGQCVEGTVPWSNLWTMAGRK